MDQIDVLIALNQETVEKHASRLKDSSFVIYDADKVKLDGLAQRCFGLPITSILKEATAPAVMKNTCIIGGYCKVVGIDWSVLEDVLKKHMPKRLELNMLVARRAYDQAAKFCRIDSSIGEKGKKYQMHLPIITGNQAISLGLINAGLEAYVAYP